MQTAEVVHLVGLENSDIKNCWNYLKKLNATDETTKSIDLIDPDLYDAIRMCLRSKYKDADDWKEWTDEIFFERLLLVCPDETSTTSTGGKNAKQRILGTKLEYSVWSLSCVVKFRLAIFAIWKTVDEVNKTPEKEKRLVKEVWEQMKAKKNRTEAEKYATSLIFEADGIPETFDSLCCKLHEVTSKLREICDQAFLCGMRDPTYAEHKESVRKLMGTHSDKNVENTEKSTQLS